MKILVATPASGGLVHHHYMLSVLTELFLSPARLANQAEYDCAIYVAASHSGLAKDRGVIASFALRENFDKLFFIDADQSFTWSDCKKLFDSPHKVIGGMVAMKKYPLQLNFAHRPEDSRYFEAEGNVTTPLGVKRWRSYHRGQDEMQVGALGTGFMLIDVSVLRDMASSGVAEPFFVPEKRNGETVNTRCWDFFSTGVINRVHYGEDFAFCVLAQRAGHTVWVNTTVGAEHHGMHTYRVPADTWEDQTAGQQRINFSPDAREE